MSDTNGPSNTPGEGSVNSLVVVEPSPEELEKAGVKWPGKIAFSGEIRGHYAGCKLMWFQRADDVNKFFEETPHIICVTMFPDSTEGGVNVLYTTALTGDELDDIAAWGRDQRAFMVERQRARDKSKQDYERAKVEAEAEQRRLAELGKKHEANCGKESNKKKGRK